MEGSFSGSIDGFDSAHVSLDMEEHTSPLVPSSMNPRPTPMPSLPPRTKRAKKASNQSIVWDHFTRVEPIDPINPKARCNYCSKLYGCHYKNGTSSMSHHLRFSCQASPVRKNIGKDKSPSESGVRVSGKGSSPQGLGTYDPENIRRLLAMCFIQCEFSFKAVENPAFINLFNAVELKYNLPSRITLQKDYISLYSMEKQKLKTLLSGQRVCLTTDIWTSSVGKKNYMCVTCHFIDRNWILNKKIIIFSHIPNHRGETIAWMLESGMMDWEIERLCAITVDNASSNDVAIDHVRRSIKDKEFTILGGEFIHVRCAAHILNLIVCDGLEEINDTINKIRDAIKFVRSSSGRIELFKVFAEHMNIDCKKMVCLDVVTRWNSTYLMLSVAEKFEKVFVAMGVNESQLLPPSYLDWQKARMYIKFLKFFYEATLKISGSLYTTSNILFPQLCRIEQALNKMCESEDEMLRSMASSMKFKFNKYWASTDRMNLIIYVTFVLDPRYKIASLAYWLKKCKGDECGDLIEAKVRFLLNRLIEQYNKFHGQGSESSSNVANVSFSSTVDDELECDDFDASLDQYFVERNSSIFGSEVDKYLSDAIEPKIPEFEILTWWKRNSFRYPILSEIVRDILTIPISTVASESAFSTSGRVLDSFRSSLASETLQALICTQNWLGNKSIYSQDGDECIEGDIEGNAPSISTT